MHRRNSISTVLTIAGSDNGGGAGIQADIKTCCAFDVYAASVVTAVTAQNSNGVRNIVEMPEDSLLAQIDTIYEVMRPDAVKIGMLPSPQAVIAVAKKLRDHNARNIVIDPVLMSSSGTNLTSDIHDSIDAMIEDLFPLATIITPNIPEACAISTLPEGTDAETLARECLAMSGAKSMLVKGGHGSDDTCVDIFYDGSLLKRYKQHRIETNNTHGTGCVLSSAIACGLAKGFPIIKALRMAKDFISYAISEGANLHLMKGNGPVYLMRQPLSS